MKKTKRARSTEHVTPGVAQADAQSEASERTVALKNALHPSTQLLCKLGSALVHADEYLSTDGRGVDLQEFKQRIADEEVQQWLIAMGPLLPLKRITR
jgi:hypothetical protein